MTFDLSALVSVAREVKKTETEHTELTTRVGNQYLGFGYLQSGC